MKTRRKTQQQTECAETVELSVRFIDTFKGHGVFSKSKIKKGTFICKYDGEILDEEEGNKRLKNDEEPGSYLFFFKSKSKGKVICTVQIKEMYVLPTFKVNEATSIDGRHSTTLGKYINDEHRRPNAKVIEEVGEFGEAVLAIYAIRDIPADTEVVYDYGDKSAFWRKLFGIQETDLQEVARHMGHELSVHREYYRLQDDVIELAKISKLLLAVESGKAHQYSGVSLDDIELDAIPELDDCVSETDLSAPLQPNNEAIQELDDRVSETDLSAPLQPNNEIAVDDIADDNIDDTVASCERKSENVRPTRKRCRSFGYVEKCDEFDFDDSDLDPDYDDGKQRKKSRYIDSDSDSDSEPTKKSALGQISKKKWSDKEKSELSELVSKSVANKKPPKKAEVQKLQAHSSVLKSIKWIKIKHQVQKIRCAEKLLQKS